MSDPITLDLYAIHHDRAQLATLHELQQARYSEHTITGGDRPAGMRLSEADPVRRVKAFLDPFWQRPFDEGVGMRGHLLEDYLEVALFHGEYAPLSGKAYESQVAIQWHRHGRSAFDFVVENHGGCERVVSCKSSIGGGKPNAANVQQERRMMALAGYPAESVFEIWVIDPGTFRATGPYEYTLEQDHIDAARRELVGVNDAYRHFASFAQPSREPEWNDPDWWKGLGLESTTNAFRYAPADASAAIEARVRAERRAAAALKAAKHDADTASDLIYQFVDEQLAAAAAAGEPVKSITAYAGDKLVSYGRKSNGAKHITERDDTAAA
jgi:hypothetical protein